MAIYHLFELLYGVVFLLKNSIEFFHVKLLVFCGVCSDLLTHNIWGDGMFADNFLHFCECILTSKRNLFSEFRNGLSVKLTLCVHLGTHFSYLIFFSTNDLILSVDHIL